MHALNLLEQRLTALTAIHQESSAKVLPTASPYIPPHALRGAQMWVDLVQAEIVWLAGVIDDLRAQRLPFSSSANWAPPADDPGYQMIRDRERYRVLIDQHKPTSA